MPGDGAGEARLREKGLLTDVTLELPAQSDDKNSCILGGGVTNSEPRTSKAAPVARPEQITPRPPICTDPSDLQDQHKLVTHVILGSRRPCQLRDRLAD